MESLSSDLPFLCWDPILEVDLELRHLSDEHDCRRRRAHLAVRQIRHMRLIRFDHFRKRQLGRLRFLEPLFEGHGCSPVAFTFLGRPRFFGAGVADVVMVYERSGLSPATMNLK